jgi:arsenate reductase
MSKLTFHIIASCDTCRKARRWLDAHGADYRVHDLREDGLDIQTLERWADRADWQTLLNTKSLTWRRLPEVDRTNVTRDRALALMLDQPTLVKRPVLEHGKSVVVGFTPEAYEALLRKK